MNTFLLLADTLANAAIATRVNAIDWAIVVGYLALAVVVAVWKGRGKQKDSASYFFAEKSLPWWVMAAAYVTTGMNTEQLVGMNGMAYRVGLPLVNWLVTCVIVVYTALIFVFFPVYLRNNVSTVPQYLGRRFDARSENVFTIILLVSFIFLNLAVVFYGGSICLSGVFGGGVLPWLILLGVVSGLVSVYGGMSSMAYTSVMQFVFVFASGFTLFALAYWQLPNGWSDVVKHDPSGFHLIKPMDFPDIPWHAIVLSLFGLQIYYSCINQSMVQRGFGGKTEWDVRVAIIAAGFAVLLRPFVEVLPGIMSRALAASGMTEFAPDVTLLPNGTEVVHYDSLLPKLMNNLVRPGFIGIMIVGVLSSVMSTISALLGSISTLFTFDVYKRWINPQADDRQLVRVGVLSTLGLMVFGIVYSPVIGTMGGIFVYFQTVAAYIAAPIATVYLFGMFWKYTTRNAAFVIMAGGIPIGIAIHYFIGWLIPAQTIRAYNLNNQFVEAGIAQAFCALLIIAMSTIEGRQTALSGDVSPQSLVALQSRNQPVTREAEIESLMWKWEYLWLPAGEPKRPFFQSIPFWWGLFMFVSIAVVIYLW